MAEVSTMIQAPPEFIEAAAKPYIKQLQTVTGGLKQADLSKIYGPQFTAGLGALTQQAINKAGGLGAYQPYLQGAEQAQQAAAGLTGPTAYQAYMSPYQQDVIRTSLAEFDVQAQKGLPALAAQAIGAGAFGGGREGVQRAEYQQASDRNRAALQAQLLQQGFGQAQQLAGQDFLRQQQLAAGQLGLAQQAPALAGQEISALTTLGGLQQGQAQAQLAAQQQLAQQQLMQPLQATQALGSGITSLIAGYPGSTQTQTQPSPTPLQTALGAGATLAGVYRAFS
jgi:hypothetical protein